jgi:hypothetical protein
VIQTGLIEFSLAGSGSRVTNRWQDADEALVKNGFVNKTPKTGPF